MPTDNNDTPSNRETRRSRGRRKWYLLGLSVLFLGAGIAYAIYYFTVAQFYAETSDAYVAGNRIQLSSQITGTVTAVHADDTDFVQAGETLVQLDPTDALNTLEHAKANLAETVRSVHKLYAQLAEQKSIIEQRQIVLAQAKRDYERSGNLLRSHSAPRQAFEHARATYHEDQAALATAQHKLSVLEAQTHGTTLHDHPRVRQAEAELRRAYLNLKRTRILAPVSGHVAQRNVQLGEQVDGSDPLLSIVPLDQVWVDANFKETDLADMRIGQPTTIISDFYGSDVTYHGHVAGISAGTGAAFELLPPQNASGNWIKIVRRVPVRIVLDDDHQQLEKYPLRLGLSMNVSVDLHDTSGARLSRKSRNTPRYHTSVYQKRLQGARQLIEKIVAANDGSDA